MTNLSTLSCFSGVGGFDFGAKLAGFNSILRSDFWNVPGEVFELNKPDAGKNIPEHFLSEGECWAGKKGDVNYLISNEGREELAALIEKSIGMHNTVDVLMGGPPCHDISLLNPKRDVWTEKNELVFAYLKVAELFNPKVVLMEQVPELASEPYRPLFDAIIEKVQNMGNYHLRFEIMNAMNYGSKQSRRRFILMLVRKDLKKLPSFPKPTEPDMSKVSINAMFKDVVAYSTGDFSDKIVLAEGKMFPTLTAGGAHKFYKMDGVGRPLTVEERMKVTDLEGLCLDGIAPTNIKKLLGNMVQVKFSEAIFNHIKHHILN